MLKIRCLFATILATCIVASAADRPRLIVMTDVGHDPDDEQQLVHLLACANQVEIEGLIPTTGRFFRPNPTDSTKWLMPHLLHGIIDGYAAVYSNLQAHATGWPTPKHLRDIVANGQTGNGMSDVGEGRWSRGARLVTSAVLKPDPRPLHIVINGGANTLAQALFEYRAAHTPEEVAAYVAKLRVFDNQGQDEAGAWICREFPKLHYVRGVEQTRAFGGPSNTELGPHVWKPFAYNPNGQHAWVLEHARTNHGALGEAYPLRGIAGRLHFLEGGGTVPWLSLISPGLTDPDEVTWGGWSGRYHADKKPNVRSAFSIVHADEEKFRPYDAYTDEGITERWTDPADGKTYDSAYVPVWRWRQAMWNDFQARMDWCVQPFAKANHHPRAALNGDKSDAILKLTAKPGEVMKFSAAGSSDPDGNALRYSWWNYPEAGRKPYGRSVAIEKSTAADISLTIPADAAGRELHLILEVWDESPIVPLVDYRRAVITVEK